MTRLGRLLRSRRLAVWTIVVLVAYVGVATFLPQGAYRSPVFIAILVILTLSTAVCALERTRQASRALRTGTVPHSAIEALRARPQFTVDLPAETPAMDVVERAFAALRLKTTRGETLAEGRSGTFALLGSPVFHWSLVLLFVVIGGGQLLRAEGLMGVVLDSQKTDSVGSYGRLETGAFHGEMSGLTIAVTEMPASYIGNGIEQGVTPYVVLSDPQGTVLAEGYVHANAPLRYRSMLIHMNDWGLAAVVTLGEGDAAITEELLFDFDDTQPSGVTPVAFSVNGLDGTAIADVRIDASTSATGEARAVVTVAPAGAALESAEASTSLMAAGDSIQLPGGTRFSIERLTRYARLSVVDDPSVSLIYALFAIAVASLTIAILVPSRVVRVLVVERPGGCVAHVSVRRSRADTEFPARVERELRTEANVHRQVHRSPPTD